VSSGGRDPASALSASASAAAAAAIAARAPRTSPRRWTSSIRTLLALVLGELPVEKALELFHGFGTRQRDDLQLVEHLARALLAKLREQTPITCRGERFGHGMPFRIGGKYTPCLAEARRAETGLTVDARRFVTGTCNIVHIRSGIRVRLRFRAALATQLEDAVAQPAQERAVMGHEQHRAVEVLQRVERHLLG